MVAEFKRFPLEKAEPTPGMQIMIAAVKADDESLRTLQESAHQKLLDGGTLSSEEKAALIVEEEERAREEREARRAAVEAQKNSFGAQCLRTLREISDIW